MVGSGTSMEKNISLGGRELQFSKVLYSFRIKQITPLNML